MNKGAAKREGYSHLPTGLPNLIYLEDDIEHPTRIINHGLKIFKDCFKWRNRINNPFVMGDYYNLLRTHQFKKQHKFPEGYIEKIIECIKVKIKEEYVRQEEQKYKFFSMDSETSEQVTQGLHTFAHDKVYKELASIGIPSDLLKASMEYAVTNADNKGNPDELLDLAQEYFYQRTN